MIRQAPLPGEVTRAAWTESPWIPGTDNTSPNSSPQSRGREAAQEAAGSDSRAAPRGPGLPGGRSGDPSHSSCLGSCPGQVGTAWSTFVSLTVYLAATGSVVAYKLLVAACGGLVPSGRIRPQACPPWGASVGARLGHQGRRCVLFSTESPLANCGQSLFQVSASRLRSRPGKWVQKGEKPSLRSSPEKTAFWPLPLAMFARP